MDTVDDTIASDLQAWIACRDEAAFHRIVERYAGLVKSVCRRQLGDDALAADATQAVFIIFARRAGSVSDPQMVPSWLYGVALRVSRNLRRGMERRLRREQTAAKRLVGTPDAVPPWADLSPDLDEAIGTLSAGERALVIGHFLQGLPQAVVAEQLGISENAAQKRIAGALVKLRAWFARRGLHIGVGALITGFASETCASEPGLTAACTQAAVHNAGSTAVTALASSAMATGTVKLTAAAVVTGLVLAGGAFAAPRFLATPQLPATAAPTARSTSPTTPAATAVPTAPDYYARWPRGIPSDPNFFPIGVFLQNPVNAQIYKQAGVNIYVGLWDGPTEANLAALSAAGMKTICDQNQVGLSHLDDPTIIGWISGGNPDLAESDGKGGTRQVLPPDAVIDRQQRLTSQDPSRPTFLLLGAVSVTDLPQRRERRGNPEDYWDYVKGGDLLGFQTYPINDATQPMSGNPWYVPLGVDHLRTWSQTFKPVWPWIECTRLWDHSANKPTPAQVRSAVWMSLIHGANGLVYFPHSFRREQNESAALLKDPEMLAAIGAINREVTALAPALNSPWASSAVTVASNNPDVPIDMLVKKHGGTMYAFAAATRDGATTATFTIPAGSTVEVIGESRSLAIAKGNFTDHFDSYAVHLYRIAPAPPQP